MRGADFCATALKGSCKFRKQASLPASPPITSATETLGCTGHSSVALARTHPRGWSGFYKCLGTNTLMRPFFKAADSSVLPWKNHRTSSLLSQTLFLKLSKSKYCTPDCFRLLLMPGFPSSSCYPVKSLCVVFTFSVLLSSEHLHALLHCNDS